MAVTTGKLSTPLLATTREDKKYWQQLHGASTVLAIANAAQTWRGITVVLVRDNRHAEILQQQLQFFFSQQAVYHFPDWEILPYDRLSPQQDIVSRRLKLLSQLAHLQDGIVLTPLSTIVQKLPPPSFLIQHSLQLKVGDTLVLEDCRQQLFCGNYQAVSQVVAHGEFCVRGAIIDIFPMGSPYPYRLELFDNEIDSIRRFDPQTQVSIDKLSQVELLPAKEFPLTADSIAYFQQQWQQQFHGDPSHCPVYQSISNNHSIAGIEYYLPLFFEQCASLFDYLPDSSCFIHVIDSQSCFQSGWQQIEDRYQQLRHDISHPILPPSQLFLDPQQLQTKCKQYPQTFIVSTHSHTENGKILPPQKGGVTFATNAAPELAINHRLTQPFKVISDFIAHSDYLTVFCSDSLGRREALTALLHEAGIQVQAVDRWQDILAITAKQSPSQRPLIVVAALEQGFISHELRINIIAETQLFGQSVLQPQRQQQTVVDPDIVIRNLTELRLGDAVVHIEHGVGRYRGLETITIDNHVDEYLILEYAQQHKLFIPISALHLIGRYSGSDHDHAPLHTLGGGQWQQTKEKAFKRIRDAASELLDIYARRATQSSHSFTLDLEDYRRFQQAFPFEETPDQQRAIEEVIADMCANKAMDRLVCGDVGFGKTEVAMRAAFIAAHNQQQVAILVPTTLLAQQHYENFCDRFVDWPISIEVLSRFRSTKQQQQIINGLQKGTIDIVIGTHRLLQQDIQFKKLGLIIIDEEHRFGVRHKEKLKSLRAEVDILALTATPIPRSLNLSLSGIRDLSLIATPPARRLSIKTFVLEYRDYIVQEAISRELMRGGQIYFLHNNVNTINKMAEELQRLVPQARIAIGHGQMREKALEKVMGDFYHQRCNILLCTTIIESGIDIPTANTILINRADKFGLAQLHQLRGRVGRSSHQAYAYLLIPPTQALSRDAKKRLEAITMFDDLGIGFNLASQDLEIRGGGELLGAEQSGHIDAIGFTLYSELLERAVSDLKSGKTPELQGIVRQDVEIQLPLNTLIPTHYLADPHLRLVFYKRLATCPNSEAIVALKVEMIDRFGLLPDETEHLFALTHLKRQAMLLGIKKIVVDEGQGSMSFSQPLLINPESIIKLAQNQAGFTLRPDNKVLFPLPETEAVIPFLSKLMKQLC